MTKRKTAVPAVMASGRLGCLFFFDMRDARLPGQAKTPVFLYYFENESRILEQSHACFLPLGAGVVKSCGDRGGTGEDCTIDVVVCP